MTEENKAQRRRRKTTTKKAPNKVMSSVVTLSENGAILPERQEANTAPPQKVAPATQEECAETIKKGPSKVTAHKDRYTKIIATEDCVGRNGGIRIDIKAGQSYTFPTPVANWLISIGRAK
jgi:hypothetical protein